MSNNEQWISGGDCDKCRRQKFCSKSCTENKRFEQRRLSSLITSMACKMFVEGKKAERNMRKES